MRGDLMGNRCVITTEKDFRQKGLGVYLHWNGGLASVRGFTEYCRLRGFAAPDKSSYGYSRLCQVIGNFMGADGSSIGIGKMEELDTDNGDNGTYILNGWKIIARRYFTGKEQDDYPLMDFLETLDSVQPEAHRLGDEMIACLMHHGKVISDVSWNYGYELQRRERDGLSCGPFREGSFYSSNGNNSIIRILEKPEWDAVIEIDGHRVTVPRFVWRDGSESLLFTDRYGMSRQVNSEQEVVP